MKECVWFTRHAPTIEQRALLIRYRIYQVFDRSHDPEKAVRITMAGPVVPALSVIIMPAQVGEHYAELMRDTAPQTTVVRPMYHADHSWTGRFLAYRWQDNGKLIMPIWEPR